MIKRISQTSFFYSSFAESEEGRKKKPRHRIDVRGPCDRVTPDPPTHHLIPLGLFNNNMKRTYVFSFAQYVADNPACYIYLETLQ